MLFGVGPALRSARVDIVDDLKGSAAVAGRFNDSTLQRAQRDGRRPDRAVARPAVHGRPVRARRAGRGRSQPWIPLRPRDPGQPSIRRWSGYDAARGREAHRGALERVRAMPGVEAASLASTVPFGEFHEGMPVEAVGGAGGRRRTDQRSPTYRIVGADYFRALGLGMVRGREFTAAEELSAMCRGWSIVDELLARQLFPEREPIGQMIRISPPRPRGRLGQRRRADGNRRHRAADARHALRQDRRAARLRSVGPPLSRRHDAARARPRSWRRPPRTRCSTACVAEIWRNSIRSSRCSTCCRCGGIHDRSLELWAVRAGGNVVISLGGLALLLALVGVYGVKSYVVSQRIREFGIRVAVGARPSDVLWLVLREGLSLTAAGLAIGLPLAVLAGFGLSRLLYEVSPLDPFVFIAAPLALAVGRATVASWVPGCAAQQDRAVVGAAGGVSQIRRLRRCQAAVGGRGCCMARSTGV